MSDPLLAGIEDIIDGGAPSPNEDAIEDNINSIIDSPQVDESQLGEFIPTETPNIQLAQESPPSLSSILNAPPQSGAGDDLDNQVDQIVRGGSPNEGGLVQSALNFGSEFLRGGVGELERFTDIRGARTLPKGDRTVIGGVELISAQPRQGFASDVARGLGQLTVQAEIVGGFAAGGAAIGTALFPGPGTAVGGAIGAFVGVGATLIQGIRSELNEAADKVKSISTAKGPELQRQMDEAYWKALPTTIAGEFVDTALAFFGAKFLRGVGTEAAKNAAKQVTIYGRAVNVLKTGGTEFAGEFIQNAGESAAAESAVSGTGTTFTPGLSEIGSEFSDPKKFKENLRAGLVGFAVGAAGRAVVEHTEASIVAERRAEFERGLDALNKLSESSQQSAADFRKAQELVAQEQKAADLIRALNNLENPGTNTDQLVVSREVATSQELSYIIGDDLQLEVLPTENGENSIVRAKADRLREIQRQKDILLGTDKEFRALEAKQEKSARRTETALSKAEQLDQLSTANAQMLDEIDGLLNEAEVIKTQIPELEAELSKTKEEATRKSLLAEIDRQKLSQQRLLEEAELIEDALEDELDFSAKDYSAKDYSAVDVTSEDLTFAEKAAAESDLQSKEALQAAKEKKTETDIFKRAVKRRDTLARQLLGEALFQEGERSPEKAIEKLLNKAQANDVQRRKAAEDLNAFLKEHGIEGMSDDEVKAIVEEAQALEHFFLQLEQDNIQKIKDAQQQVKTAQKEVTDARNSGRKTRLSRAESTLKKKTRLLKKLEASLTNLKDLGLRSTKRVNGRPTAIDIIAETPVQTITISRAGIKDRLGPQESRRELALNERAGQTSTETVVDSTDSRPVEDLSAAENRRNTNPKRSIFAAIDEKLEQRRIHKQFALARLRGTSLQSIIETETLSNIRKLESVLNSYIGGRGLFARPKGFLKQVGPTGIRERVQLLNEINKALVGDIPIDSLPIAFQPIVKEIRASVDRTSQMLIDEGVVEGPLVQIIEAGKGTYLNRSYRVFTDPNWSLTVDESIKNNAKGLIRRQINQQSRNSTLTEAQLEQKTNDIMNELLSSGQNGFYRTLSNIKTDKSLRTIFKKRKDIPEEIRALLGERTGAIENYAQSMLNMSALLGANEYLTNIKEIGLGDFLFTSPQPGFDVAINMQSVPFSKIEGGDKFPAAHALTGPDGKPLYTSREIAKYLDTVTNSNTVGPLARVVYQAIAAAKYSKTIGSPISQVRNFASNILFLVANGNIANPNVFSLNSLGEASRLSFGTILPNDFLDPTTDTGKRALATFKKLQRLGIVGESVQYNEILKERDDLFNSKGSLSDYLNNKVDVGISGAANQGKKIASSAIEASSRLYQASDSFWKVLAFHSERDKYQSAFPEKTDAELDRIAADIVRATMPTYSEAPEIVQKFRRNPLIAPFATFPAEVVRNTYNSLKIARREIADPRTRSIGYKRLGSQLSTQAALSGIVYLGKYLSGVGDEDDKKIRGFSAPWDSSSDLFHLPKISATQWRFVNMSYTNPYGYLRNPVNAFLKSDDWKDGLIAAADQLLSPFVNKDIFIAKASEVYVNADANGEAIYKESESGALGTILEQDNAYKVWNHLSDAVRPGIAESINRLYSAYYGQRYRGKVPNLQIEMLAHSLGQRIVTVDIPHSFVFKAKEFKDSKSIAQNELGAVWGNRDPISNESIRAAWRKFKADRTAAYEKISKLYWDGTALVGSPDEFDTVLKSLNIGKADSEFIRLKETPKFTAGDALRTRIQSQANPGRMEQIAQALGDEFDDVFEEKTKLRTQSSNVLANAFTAEDRDEIASSLQGSGEISALKDLSNLTSGNSLVAEEVAPTQVSDTPQFESNPIEKERANVSRAVDAAELSSKFEDFEFTPKESLAVLDYVDTKTNQIAQSSFFQNQIAKGDDPAELVDKAQEVVIKGLNRRLKDLSNMSVEKALKQINETETLVITQDGNVLSLPNEQFKRLERKGTRDITKRRQALRKKK